MHKLPQVKLFNQNPSKYMDGANDLPKKDGSVLLGCGIE